MKFKMLYILIFLLSGSVSAQESVTSYLDGALKPIKKKSKSTFRQEISPYNDKFKIKTYTKSDVLVMEAISDVDNGQNITGEVSYYHENGNLESKGSYLNGKKLGVWKRYDTTGKEKSERVYNLFNPEVMAYHFTDVMPLFPGGEENFEHFLQQNFAPYVEKTVSKGELLRYSFVVNTNGNIDNIKIIKSVSTELDAELKMTLSKMPTWKPGEKYGEKVRVIVEKEIYCKR